jgi:flagellar biosynthesis regulator FlbT
MKDIKFQELKVNDKFFINGIEYTRVADKRVSCCKVLNAVASNEPSKVIQVKPLTVVQVEG